MTNLPREQINNITVKINSRLFRKPLNVNKICYTPRNAQLTRLKYDVITCACRRTLMFFLVDDCTSYRRAFLCSNENVRGNRI